MYDVGEFDGHMTVALERADWTGFDARLAASKAEGKIRGIGIATYIEACAFAGSEPAFVELNGDGSITLKIGTQSNGQGHATAYAQLVAEKLGVEIDKVHMRQGDTDELSKGGGTGGSRSIPLGGVSSALAGEDLAVKIRKHRRRRTGSIGRRHRTRRRRRAHRRHRPLDGLWRDRQGRQEARRT